MPRRVVILGGGFGGYACVRALARAEVEVTLIDKENHFLFQPLLYQVATAGLSPANVAWPIRSLLSRQKNVTVLMAEVLGVDTDTKQVLHSLGSTSFDDLVVATGATHGYFGHDEWEEHASGLKSLDDATAVRSRILGAFELAEACEDMGERDALLTIVVVGGGPTGVEMAGSLAELSRRTLARDFRRINPAEARIVLVEGRRVLAEFPEPLANAAVDSLSRLGVEVRLGEFVESITASGVQLPSGWIPARTVVWAAGVQASPAAQWLSCEHDANGRVVVDSHCRVKGLESVYAIGDVARFETEGGRLLPGTCPVAMQQGEFVADCILGKKPSRFVYHDKGILATVGRSSAVAKIGKLELSGLTAWILWMGLHLWTLLSGQSKVLVFLQWIWAYVSYSRGARLITRHQHSSRPPSTRKR